MEEEVKIESTAEPTSSVDISGAIESMTPEPIKETPEATMEDAANVSNPNAVIYNNPELSYKPSMEKGGVDIEDPVFKKLYDEADGKGKVALADATDIRHAIAIAGRTEVLQKSMDAMNNEPFLTQLGMSILPNMANMSNALPFGAIGYTMRLGKQVGAVNRILIGMSAGGITGAAANLTDEALFETQGVQYDYLTAGLMGLGFGGLLGTVGSVLSGPGGKSSAFHMSKDGDTFTAVFATDPNVRVEVDESGAILISPVDPAKQRKGWFDHIPALGEWMRSDVNTIFQDSSSVLRKEASKWFAPTVSHRDADGNVIPTNWNAQNEKALTKGYYNALLTKTQDLHRKAKDAGYKGGLDQFISDVSTSYTNAMAKQELEVYKKLVDKADEINTRRKGEKTAAHAEIDADRPVYYMPDGTKRELNDQDLLDLEENANSKAEYDKSVADIKTYNDSVDADIEVALDQMEAEGKFAKLGKTNNKKLRDAARVELNKTMGSSKIEQPAPWEKPNLIDDKKVKLEPKNQDVREKAKEEYNTKDKEDAEAEINEATNKIYDENQGKFEGDEHITKAAEAHREYYTKMLEHGQKNKMEGLGGLSKNRIYRPRTWDFESIKDKYNEADVKATLTDAFVSHPNQSGYSADGVEKAVDNIYKSLLDSGFDIENLSSTFVVPEHLPFEGMLKSKKWRLDESKLGELLKDNLADTTGAYNFKMSGRIAAAKITGDQKWGEYIKDLEVKLRDEGTYSKEALQAFARSVEDTIGTLRMDQQSGTKPWTWARNLSSYNSLRLGGGFGGNQFIELVSNIVMQGMTALVNGRFKATWKNAGGMLYQGKAPDDEFTQSIIASGFMDTALYNNRINKFADTEMGLNPGFMEKTLHGLQEKLMKYNGMRYFTAVMEDQAGGSIMTQVGNMAKKGKLSDAEAARLARWGMSHEQAKNFAKDMDMYYRPQEGKLELDKFSSENQMLFQKAIQNGVSEMVIQGDSIHLPSWMKTPGPMLKLLTQFMRFPMIAQEVLLKKGFKEDQARYVGGIIASTATYMALKYTREQASIAAGSTDEIDSKFDYFGRDGDEAINRAVMGSMSYNAPLGMMSSLWDYGALATGNPGLGKDYMFDKGVSAVIGPTGSLAGDFLKLMQSASKGEFGTEKDMMILKGGGPTLSLPIISEGIRDVIKN